MGHGELLTFTSGDVERRARTAFQLAIVFVLAFVALNAFGSATPVANNPNAFVTPLQNLIKMFTGPIAMGLSMAGIIACGVALIFGGDMKEFVKTMFTLVLVVCLIISAASLVNAIFDLDWGSSKIAFS